MSMNNSYTQIALLTFGAGCDFCFRSAPKPSQERQPELTIRSTGKKYQFFDAGAPYDTIPPVQETVYRSELIADGWKFETIHGKEMLVCPQCQQLQSANAGKDLATKDH